MKIQLTDSVVHALCLSWCNSPVPPMDVDSDELRELIRRIGAKDSHCSVEIPDMTKFYSAATHGHIKFW